MAERASKRRRLSPSEDEEEESFASFASGGSDDGENGREESAVDEDLDEAMESANDSNGEDDDEVDAEDSDEGEEDSASSIVPSKATASKAQPHRTQNGTNGTTAAFTGEIYESNTFKLQVDNLLQSVRPKYTSKDKAIGEALRTLKGVIESIHPRQAISVVQAEATLRKGENVNIPFPDPRPPKDANYKLQYAKPASINVVGSFALSLGTKTGDAIEVDLVVQMPDEIFQEKDYLNHRYFYKRAYYLACLAAGIKSHKEEKYKISFENAHGNHLTPVLAVEISRETHPDLKLPSKVLRITVRPTVAEGLFVQDKLLPSKNGVRSKDLSTTNETQKESLPTPFYNASLRADALVTSFLTLQHQATKQTEAYRDACVLGRIWLRQRGLTSGIKDGGFGNFEWSVIIALLLKGGGSNGMPAFSAGYSSYQLFKAALQYLATRDLAKTPQVIGSGAKVDFLKDGTPAFFDAERGMNVLFKMTPWSWQLLKWEAKASVAMLSDSTFEHFDETFILRSDRSLLRYDVVVEIPIPSFDASDDAQVNEKYKSVYSSLNEGLGDRVKLINLTPPGEQGWSISSKAIAPSSAALRIGFILDPANAHRLIDHGPTAEDKAASIRFRKFWGPKAELRRFRDGSILETVIWPAKDESKHSVFRRILTYVLNYQVSETVAKSMTYSGDVDATLLSALSSGQRTASTAPFQPIMDAFRQLEQDLRGLDDLPLQIRLLLASDPYLSYSSVDIPHTPHTHMTRPANVILQFEGSARWPDDLDAIQRTKMAFFLKIADLLESSGKNIRARVGLENGDAPLLNQSFLDVHYTGDQSSPLYGASFRIRVHHDREVTLLERMLKDKSAGLSQLERQEVAAAIAEHKRVFSKEPSHTQALQTLATRFPAYSGTVRILGKWITSHNLSNHISAPLVSLFAARAFTNPAPWTAASSPQAGFYRALLYLSRWNWRTEPWISDLGSTMSKSEVEAIRTRFEAWRKLDPALNRVVIFAASNVDGDGTTWTDNGRPAKVIAGRVVGLAKAAVDVISSKGVQLDPEVLFEGGLEDYDFVVHLNSKVLRQGKKKGTTKYKNLELQLHEGSNGSIDDFTLSAAGSVGFEPAKLFLADLERVFGQAALFFHDEQQGEYIAGLWDPGCEGSRWKLSQGFNAIPSAKDGGFVSSINKNAVLAEVARLGGDMIERFEVNER